MGGGQGRYETTDLGGCAWNVGEGGRGENDLTGRFLSERDFFCRQELWVDLLTGF